MSQARQIYEFLTATNNKAADTGLLLGLRRAEEPYRTALLEVILDRGQSTATYKLISQWHQFGPAWQKLLADRAQSLYGGLFQAGRDKNMQIRLNCLSIIRQGQYVPLAELVVALLRDRVNEVSREAGSILLDWARHFRSRDEQNQIRKTEKTEDTSNDDQAGGARAVKSSDEQQLFISALERAVRDYPVHQKSQALRAAMCVVGTQVKSFWKERLGP